MFRTKAGVWFAMKKFLFVGLLVALGTGSVSAQSGQQKVDIEFQFVAAGHELPADSYRVTMGKDESGQVELVLRGTEVETRLPVITRLSPRGGNTSAVDLVFDRVDGKNILSEVWLPNFDGFLVNAAKGQHDHQVVGDGKGR
jgi:hypothetical protein